MVAVSKLSTIKAAKLLNVKIGETDKGILKAAYKKAALVAHPDKGGDETRFVAVAEAYQVLLRAKGKKVRSYDDSESTSEDEIVADTLTGRIVDPHALFAATFGSGGPRMAIGDDGYEREMNRSGREQMWAYDVDGADDVRCWGRYERTGVDLHYANAARTFLLERRGNVWVLASARDRASPLYECKCGDASAPLHGWTPAVEGLAAPPRVRYVRDAERETRPPTIWVRLDVRGERKLGLRISSPRPPPPLLFFQAKRNSRRPGRAPAARGGARGVRGRACRLRGRVDLPFRREEPRASAGGRERGR